MTLIRDKLLVTALGLTLIHATAQAWAAPSTKSESHWEAAASNRDAAAHAQSNQALLLLTQADDQREQDAVTREAQRHQFSKIGALEISAGAMFWKAQMNFTKAAESWGKAAADHTKRGAHQFARTARSHKEESLLSARHASHLAAQSYERAADAYAPKHAADFVKSATASEKAAECREFIAKKF